MQQLREKDDANFKLISERIKLENVQKILKEEKDSCASQVKSFYLFLFYKMNAHINKQTNKQR